MTKDWTTNMRVVHKECKQHIEYIENIKTQEKLRRKEILNKTNAK